MPGQMNPGKLADLSKSRIYKTADDKPETVRGQMSHKKEILRIARDVVPDELT